MAHDAPFPLEYLLASFGERIELVGVRRRLQRVNVEGEGIQLLVAITVAIQDSSIENVVHDYCFELPPTRERMLHQVDDASLHAMSGIELSRVRTELRLLPHEATNKSLIASRGPILLRNQVESWGGTRPVKRPIRI